MTAARFKWLQAGLLFVLIFSPVFFGSVHDLASQFFCAVLFLLLFFFPESVLRVSLLPSFFALMGVTVLTYVTIQSLALSWIPSVSRMELLKWLATAAAVLLVQSLPEKSRSGFFKAALAVAVFEACYGLIQTRWGMDRVLWRPQESHRGFATGTFLNRNHLAGLFQMAMGIQLGFLLRSLHLGKRWAALGYSSVFLLTGFVFFQTGSRMGLLSFFISVCIFTLLLLLRLRTRPALFFLTLSTALIAAAFFMGRHQLLARLPDSGLWEQTWGGRHLVWRDTLGMIKDHFWLGTGLGSYEWAFPQYQSVALLMKWAHAHNDYLELASNLGVPVFLFWSVGVLGFLWAALRYSFQHSKGDAFSLEWGVYLGLLSFLIHGLSDFNWAMASHGFWFFMLLAAVYRKPEGTDSKKSMNSLFRRAVQGASFLLMLLAVKNAWAGAALYKAERAVLGNDYALAAQASQQALQLDPLNSTGLFLLGRSSFEYGVRNNDEASLKAAQSALKKLTAENPYYSRAWLYLAFSEEALAGMTGEVFPAQRALIQSHFNEALKREPASAWISYIVSTYALDHPQRLSEEEKKEAFERLRVSVSLHFDGQASPYLQLALEFLWKRFNNFDLLIEISPKEYASYRVLLGFVDENRLWDRRNQVSSVFLKLSGEDYKEQCDKAWRLFRKQKWRDAFELFQKSYWMRQELIEAKIGMLASGFHLHPRDFPRDRSRQLLEEVLEQEDQIPVRYSELESSVHQTGEPYLKGLWNYRVGHTASALESFEADEKFIEKTRRWRADAYQKLGQNKKAAAILLHALKEENPDLRELRLLQRVDKKTAKDAEVKMNQILKRQAKRSLSLGETAREMSPTWLNLLPGKTQMDIQLRKDPSLEAGAGCVRLSLWEGRAKTEIASVSIPNSDWKFHRVIFETAGGGRLLTAEILSDAGKGDGEKTSVEFGILKVKAIS